MFLVMSIWDHIKTLLLKEGTCCFYECGVFSSDHWDPLVYDNF
jgi:hypothetical protein